jgi:hypothetical protein
MAKIGAVAKSPGQAGGRSKLLEKQLEKEGLPTLRELHALMDTGFAAKAQERVDLMLKYTAARENLYRLYTAAGFRAVNAIQMAVELQAQLYELEEKIRAEGQNPIENPDWLKAREMLAKEVTAIQKLGLDAAKFEADLTQNKVKTGEDSVFTVGE